MLFRSSHFHRHHRADQGNRQLRPLEGGSLADLRSPLHRKCYPITNAFQRGKCVPQGAKQPVWRILDRISADLYILSCAQNSYVRYAPLYIHSFVLCAPRKILEATKFNQRYRRYEEIENVADRLCWCRHSKG